MIPETYNFTSYADAEGETEWDSGTVETTGVVTDGYTQVEVITNPEHPDFVGQKFYITSDAVTDGEHIYQLYTDAGVTGAGIYVSITVPTQNVGITVTDGTDPINGATVVIGETSKTTGSAGGCTFNGVTYGTHTVTVSKDGYTTKTESITVDADNSSFTISLVSA